MDINNQSRISIIIGFMRFCLSIRISRLILIIHFLYLKHSRHVLQITFWTYKTMCYPSQAFKLLKCIHLKVLVHVRVLGGRALIIIVCHRDAITHAWQRRLLIESKKATWWHLLISETTLLQRRFTMNVLLVSSEIIVVEWKLILIWRRWHNANNIQFAIDLLHKENNQTDWPG